MYVSDSQFYLMEEVAVLGSALQLEQLQLEVVEYEDHAHHSVPVVCAWV